jgi:hypothetical protein
MSFDQTVFLLDGIVIGVDTCLLIHFGGRIWDDFRGRRAARRRADAVDALTTEEQE